MMKKLSFLLTSLLLILALAGCGTAGEQNGDSDSAKEPEEETNAKDEGTAEKEKQADENDQSVEQKNPAQSENGDPLENANVVEEEQYTIQVLDGYELTKEEPGKEVLFLKENDAVFMRIEAVSKNDAAFDDLVKNTEETMAAIGQYKPYDLSDALKAHPEISNSAAYISKLDNEQVIGIVYEKNNLLVRLTIYDQSDYNSTNDFIRMGLSIKGK
ncbi:hypothetical protein P4476_08535 [Ureibacillus terrenus]|nr:hypothetical protein [Ureibacillus terrenus]